MGIAAMPSLRLYDFLVRFNSSSNVKVFLWIVAIIHVVTVALCMVRAILDNPNGWPWAVLFLNLFNLIVLTIDARSYGLSNPLMAFLVIVSESLCLAANIMICFIVGFRPDQPGPLRRQLTQHAHHTRGPSTCAASRSSFFFSRFFRRPA